MAQPDLLRQARSDWLRYSSLAGLVVTAALASAVSGALALVMILNSPVAVAVSGGIGWGSAVLTTYRYLAVTGTRNRMDRRRLIAVCLRLALAVVLGIVVSTPLVLAIFKPEIDAEVAVVRLQKEADLKSQLNNAVDGVLSELADQQKVANASIETLVAEDRAVVSAQQKVAVARTSYEDAQRRVFCELDGSCTGTGVPGSAETLRERTQVRDRLSAEYDEAKAALDRAESSARSAAPETVTRAKAEADRLTSQLAALRAERSVDTGLNSQLIALGRLSRYGYVYPVTLMLQLMVWMLLALPILVPMFGSPTLYDQLQSHARQALEQEITRSREIADELELYELELTRSRARFQFERQFAKALAERDHEVTIPTGGNVPPLRKLDSTRVFAPTDSLSRRKAAEPRAAINANVAELESVPARARIRILTHSDPVVGVASQVDFSFVRVGQQRSDRESPTTVRVLLDAPDAHVSPLTHRVVLDSKRESAPVVFDVVPHQAGNIDLRFRVYTDADGQLLQEISSSIEVGKA